MNKKSYSSAEIIKLLESAGFVLDRVKGSHHIYLNPEPIKNEQLFLTQRKTCLSALPEVS
jgi:hypothetical protein